MGYIKRVKKAHKKWSCRKRMIEEMHNNRVIKLAKLRELEKA